MIVFELTMPNRGSWNGKWSGDGKRFIRIVKEREVPRKLWDKTFIYRWDDGWTACVELKRMNAQEARKLEKFSSGFSGYDWMIVSIIKNGCIMIENEKEVTK